MYQQQGKTQSIQKVCKNSKDGESSSNITKTIDKQLN
jgi:hypothetical protein